jgi:UDP-N-acetylglucosamine enolpyruvyl transferase
VVVHFLVLVEARLQQEQGQQELQGKDTLVVIVLVTTEVEAAVRVVLAGMAAVLTSVEMVEQGYQTQ